jgi:energy-coupling factor transporter ATP-binding protein EcfA2
MEYYVMFEFDNVSCSYDQQPLFDPITHTIFKHDKVLIQGVNGVGKTTLLRTMLGLHSNYQGRLLFDHQPIEKYERYQIGQLVGFVNQQPSYQLFGMTVWQECIMFAKWRKQTLHDEQVIRVLEQLNLLHLRDQHPQLCSRGEQQRLSLAIALLQQPAFILLDEPTTALDDKHVALVLNIIAKNNQIGWVVVSHDERIKQANFNQIITLNKELSHEDS